MITSIRKSFLNAYTALPLLICFVLASFHSFALNNKATRATFLSGQELFAGVFFLEGRYAQMLPETQSFQTAYLNQQQSSDQKAAVAQVRQAVLAQIESARPGYFAHFKSAMKSGDHLRVSAALAEGQALVGQALDVLYELDKAELGRLQAKAQAEAARQGGKLDAQAIEKLVADMQKGKAVDANSGTCAVIAVVVLVVAVAAVWVAIAVSENEVLSDNRNTKSLMHEQLVASICEVAPSIA
ncbi:hypothetical protein [Spirosoma montaniterrae]|uniref:Uncharacterized protein n=1 Tax=Spirosoma montaniterrae TaxID=1178516 RepID=A0A1P9WZ65_9BACT|nr:hypothetical protein [Spirosoma montaniterrae]AQG80669.1 hypothetical protein AWR27_15845 [Spirosoma montaniterrae]